MVGLNLDVRTIGRAAVWLAILIGASETALGQVEYAGEEVARRAAPRAKVSARDATAADRITLRDGEELLGQVDEPSPKGTLSVLARRDVGPGEPPRTGGGVGGRREDGDRRRRADSAANAWPPGAANARPTPGPGDRITAWLDGELSESRPGRSTRRP